MYSKHEANKLKQEFWTAFGQYMSPILSAGDEKINWINYRTGEKDIFFRMNADHQQAYVAIELTHKDESLQALYFEQFKQLQSLLENTLQEQWKWQLYASGEKGKTVSRIYVELNGINIFNRSDWPQLISFFKPRIIALDEFWLTAKHVFETLR